MFEKANTTIVYTDAKSAPVVRIPREVHVDCNSDPLQLSGLIKARTHATKAWLSCDFRLDKIKIKEQTFTIKGWINVVWREPNTTDLYVELMSYSTKPSIKHSLSRADEGNLEKMFRGLLKDKNVWWYRDNDFLVEHAADASPAVDKGSPESPSVHIAGSSDDCMRMRILDLREADQITYYLPIDPNRIFYHSSIDATEHKDPPYLIFNPSTGVIRTAYHVKVSLSQPLDLYWFPFDKQCLNIKLRWNKLHYRLLQWQTEDNKIPNKQHFFDTRKDKVRHYDIPFRASVTAELQQDIVMHEPHFDFNLKYPGDKEGETPSNRLAYALISLRFTRNSRYYVSYILFPLFAIVFCSFSIYAIPRENIVERLNVSVTILLTFTAFQNITAHELPVTSVMEFVDLYIMCAYCIQLMIIVGSILASFGQYDEMSDYLPSRWNYIGPTAAFWIDFIIGLSLFVVWFTATLIYACCHRQFQLRACCYGETHVQEFWRRKEEEAKNVWYDARNKVQIYSQK